MNLALYSGGTAAENASMNAYVLSMITKRNTSEIVYITTPQEKNEFALKWLHDYFDELINVTFIPYFIDATNTPESINEFNNATVILLTGGNTFYVMKHLRESGTDNFLENFSKTNGLMIGFSAGSLVMTPTIALAHLPSFDCDDNAVNPKNEEGIGLVKFEVQPHYEEGKQYDAEMRKYSLSNGRPIYALKDGSGIVVESQKEKMFGNIVMFDAGEKIKVACNC